MAGFIVKNRNHITIGLAVCLLFAFSVRMANAQDSYQSEISADYYRSDDKDHNTNSNYALNAKIHLSPVSTAGHPFAEAAFLERIGNVQAFVIQSDFKSSSGIEASRSSYGAALTYAKPDLPVVLQATYSKRKGELKSPASGEATADTYGLGLAYFLDKNLLAGIKYTESEPIIINGTTPASASISKGTSKTKHYSLTAKYVKEHGDGTAYNIEGLLGVTEIDYSSKKSNRTYGIAGDYYFNQKFSLGGGLTLDTGDNKSSEGKTVSLGVTAFLNQQFAVIIGFNKFNADNDQGRDRDSYNVTMLLRF